MTVNYLYLGFAISLAVLSLMTFRFALQPKPEPRGNVVVSENVEIMPKRFKDDPNRPMLKHRKYMEDGTITTDVWLAVIDENGNPNLKKTEQWYQPPNRQ